MKGVLLGNLGSTKSPAPEDVKVYLDEFLMDPLALDVPYWLRAFIVRGIILKRRPQKTGANYERIWWDEGSPLIVISERLKEKLQKKLDLPVALGMRYGQPSMKSALQELVDKGVDEVFLLPLYPQYAMATTKTFVEEAEAIKKEAFPELKLSSARSFYNHPAYIDVLAKSMAEKLEQLDYDHLLFSYHGVPERHIRKMDVTDGHCKMNERCCRTDSPAHKYCYRHQCLETTRLVAERLGLDKGDYTIAFQSRLGLDKWLKPYTDETLKELAKKGKKKLAVATPAFVADCIETLDEIAREGKETFQEAGGEDLNLIPCLNDRDDWVSVLGNWIDSWADQSETVGV